MQMNLSRLILPTLLIALLGFDCPSLAQTVPAAVTYQGRLTDASGANLPDGTGYEIEARLWQSQTSTTPAPVWASRYTGVPVRNGGFTLILASGGTAIGSLPTDVKAALANTTIYLGLTLTKNATGSAVAGASEILPRQQLLASPFAVRADVAASVVTDSIVTSSIRDGEVKTADLANAAVTNQKLAPNSVTLTNIVANTITSSAIAGNSIDLDRLNLPDGSFPVSKLSLNCASYTEEKASGSDPTDSPSGQTGSVRRTLNKTVFSKGTSIARSGSTITLQPGVYRVDASAPAYGKSNYVVNSYSVNHALLLRRTSAPLGVVIQGGNVVIEDAGDSSSSDSSPATFSGFVEVTGSAQTFEVFHSYNIGRNGTLFFGAPASFTDLPEVYTQITIQRIQ